MKSLNLVSIMTAATLLTGCEQGQDFGAKRQFAGAEWYDYGNGIINLAQVKIITSSAVVRAEAMPREFYENNETWRTEGYSDEEIALINAHADYCYDRARSSNSSGRYNASRWTVFEYPKTLGAFEKGEDAAKLKNAVSTLRESFSAEFAKYCVVKISGEASLVFDDFKVQLEPYKTYINIKFEKDQNLTDEQVRSKLDEQIGDLANGKTPWDGAYKKLVEGA